MFWYTLHSHTLITMNNVDNTKKQSDGCVIHHISTSYIGGVDFDFCCCWSPHLSWLCSKLTSIFQVFNYIHICIYIYIIFICMCVYFSCHSLCKSIILYTAIVIWMFYIWFINKCRNICLKPHSTTYSYLLPLYSKQYLIGACWSPMILFFYYVNWELISWDNHLSVTLQGGLISPA